jgi:hypothetical protein
VPEVLIAAIRCKNTLSVNNRSTIDHHGETLTTMEARTEDQMSNSPTLTKAGSSRRSLVLALITLAQFMVIVDSTIVQVALPSIGRVCIS